MAISCSEQTLTEEDIASAEAKISNTESNEAGMINTLTNFDAALKQLPESIAIDHLRSLCPEKFKKQIFDIWMLQRPVKTIGSENTPTIPLNSILEETMIP